MGRRPPSIMVNGVLDFTMGPHRYVIGADAGTGQALWLYRPDEGDRFTQAPRKVHRGVSCWIDGRGDERILFAAPGFHLIVLDVRTGAPPPCFTALISVSERRPVPLYFGVTDGRAPQQRTAPSRHGEDGAQRVMKGLKWWCGSSGSFIWSKGAARRS